MDKFKRLLYSLFSHLYTWEIWVGILLPSFFINLLGLVFPLAILQFYDRIIPNQATYTLMILILIVVSATFFEALLKTLRSSIIFWASARYEYLAGLKIFKQITDQSHDPDNKLAAGDYLERMNGLINNKDFYGGQILTLLIDFPFVVLYVVLIAYMGGFIFLITLAGLLFFFYNLNNITQGLQSILSEKKSMDDKRYNFILEVIKGIQTIKAYAMESVMLRRYERLQTHDAVTDQKISKASLNSEMSTQYIMQTSMIILVALGSIKIINGELTIGALSACVLLSNRTLVPLNSAMMLWKRAQSVLISQDRQQELSTQLKQPPLNRIRKKIEGKIELRAVDFGYQDHPSLFKNMNLLIEPKTTIAITSAGGAGKTSLLKLVMGIYQPRKGTILIDDLPIEDYEPDSLHQQIAFLPEHSQLFNGTIMENLTLFNESLVPKALSMAKAMGLDDKIHRLPEGYETKVGGQSNSVLNAATRQLIAAIQNLIKEPKIVLFDESNSAVDLETDRVFHSLIRWLKERSTLIIISYRPSLIKIADKVYQLDNGTLKENKESE